MKPPVFIPGKQVEAKHVHTWFRRELLKRYPDAYIYKPPGGAYGKKGAHDFIICIEGLFFSIEAKIEGKCLTPKQEETKDNVNKAGGFSCGLFGKDETIFGVIESYLRTYSIERK